ncbi:MAG TPA: transglycosylase SLT domain-containing protein [Acidocella sp.]|nr:MAG: hypothetical protein B7Z81_01360 [Acidocella sp. 20-61-6]HQT47299.1 transglycosylase SLT domain-containing protein [Acidocella sp.]
MGLAMLSACASTGPRMADSRSTAWYIAHAAHNYVPPGPASDPWGPYIRIASRRFDVPAPWIRWVMHVESGGHEYIGGQLTVSSAGAMGLMQLEPGTYQQMADQYGLGQDPFNPFDNIMAGSAYIHQMYQVFGSPGFLAAYDAGPGRLAAYMHDHKRLPDETINYVAMIAPHIQGYYPDRRSGADELALNTEPATRVPGILPSGFIPDAPRPRIADLPRPPRLRVSAPERAPTPVPMPVAVAAVAPNPNKSATYAATRIRAASLDIPPPQTPRERISTNRRANGSAIYTPAVQTAQVDMPHHPMHSPHTSFSIIPAAMADTPPPTTGSIGHVGWAIQLGSYDTSSHARAALGIAELAAVRMLVHGKPVVISVHHAGHTAYRARVLGLPHDLAVNACDRLSRGPTGCLVLSPDAQSS